jgi:3-oxoacid CoA-transferase subunit A
MSIERIIASPTGVAIRGLCRFRPPCGYLPALRDRRKQTSAFSNWTFARSLLSPSLLHRSTIRDTRCEPMDKLYPNAAAALEGLLRDGLLIASGGFGISGIPERLLDALRDSGVRDITFASNNAGIDNEGIGKLLRTKQVRMMIASYVGENKEFERQYLAGELEVEFCPQGTLAERMRAGGAGIPGFYTKTGVGTLIAEGKEVKTFDGEDYILERGIFADLSLVKAWKADATGNTIFRKTARNFNVPAATCGKVCLVEVEEIVPTGSLDPDNIHLPGVFVQRLVLGAPYDKKIEFRTVRERETA